MVICFLWSFYLDLYKLRTILNMLHTEKLTRKVDFTRGKRGKNQFRMGFFYTNVSGKKIFGSRFFSTSYRKIYFSQTKPITLYQLFYVYFLFLLGKFIHKSAYDEFHQNVMRSLYRHFRLRA